MPSAGCGRCPARSFRLGAGQAREQGDSPFFPPPATPASGSRLHVLLAEDNPYNQAVMEDLLPSRGHTLQVAGDGRSALAALEQDRFDVLLLDIHMPELDG